MKNPFLRFSVYVLTFFLGDNLYHSDHERKLSTSSSDYSYDSDAKSEASTRRGTTPSKGGADRRRVAIVQMPSFRSRRGQTPLALVAPPDAAPTNYTHLTPPPTANIPSDQDTTLHQRDISTTKDDHQNSSCRSQSPSRRFTTSNIPLSPSPMFSPVTLDTGQAKEIHIPGAGSVVVNLGSHLRNAPSSGTDSPPPDTSLLGTPISSYLHYQPGFFFFQIYSISRFKPLQVYIRSLVPYPLLQEPIST